MADQLEGRTIALWGLSFKPNTDDMREAPSRALMEALWDAGARVKAFDPAAMHEARKLYPAQVEQGLLVLTAADAECALKDADALVICTEWREFQMPDYTMIREMLEGTSSSTAATSSTPCAPPRKASPTTASASAKTAGTNSIRTSPCVQSPSSVARRQVGRERSAQRS